jgi:hypothetical protein
VADGRLGQAEQPGAWVGAKAGTAVPQKEHTMSAEHKRDLSISMLLTNVIQLVIGIPVAKVCLASKDAQKHCSKNQRFVESNALDHPQVNPAGHHQAAGLRLGSAYRDAARPDSARARCLHRR